MNATIAEKIQNRLANTAGSWFTFRALNASHPAFFLSVIMVAIWRVTMFILASCNRNAKLVRAYTGPFYGLINLVAYSCLVYVAGQWIAGRVASAGSGRKRIVNGARKGTKAKMGGGTSKTAAEKGVVALCYTNGVFDHEKATQYIEDIDQAVRMNTVLNHLMNPDLQKSLEGIRADTPMREFQTTFNTIKDGRTGPSGLGDFTVVYVIFFVNVHSSNTL
ncbi:hypothetical protein D9619_012563 [Psilocybe cf. subviscida]|uniref:Uncharacterized protein n=1 Tax=Psilocybe cf. subviscida TaxID=2480587 RepID=A0A8H5EZ90_9AGAR|nr:hypothetical protein D9619_012563 [Psilocybe cf. subviscida]